MFSLKKNVFSSRFRVVGGIVRRAERRGEDQKSTYVRTGKRRPCSLNQHSSAARQETSPILRLDRTSRATQANVLPTSTSLRLKFLSCSFLSPSQSQLRSSRLTSQQALPPPPHYSYGWCLANFIARRLPKPFLPSSDSRRVALLLVSAFSS